MRLRYAALSDVGRVRRDNQDSGYAGPHLLVVADGVGGSARGDIASSSTVEVLRRLDKPPVDDLLGALAGAIHLSHDRIAGLVADTPEIEGTSTTVTAVIFDGTQLGVGHVGDSRGYLLRDGTLAQLTTDHTFVQSLIDEGRITEDEARVHPHRNLILRAVDGVHEPEPDVFTREVALGDRILLCSDGCSGALTDTDLARILGEGTPDHAAVSLISASLEAGSSDNVTVVVADVVADDADDDAETSASAVTGPMLVGAAAEAPRRGGLGSGQAARTADTGELEPVRVCRGRRPRPRGGALRPPAPAPVHLGATAGRARPDRRARGHRRDRRLQVDPESVLRGQRRRPGGGLPRRRGRRTRPSNAQHRGEQQPGVGRPADLQRSAGARRDQRGQPGRRARHRHATQAPRGVPPAEDAEPQCEPQREGHFQRKGQPELEDHQEAPADPDPHAEPEPHALGQPLARPVGLHRGAMSSSRAQELEPQG